MAAFDPGPPPAVAKLFDFPIAERESMSTAAPLKLLIVGDTRLYCDGVAHLLRLGEQCVVLCVAYTAAEALDQLASKSPDIALVDIGMKEGYEMIRSITRNRPGVHVVALGMDESQENIILCAEAGAAGYVPRTASIDDLVAVLQSAHNDELRCSPRVAGTLLKRVAALAAIAEASGMAGVHALTQREREIVNLISLQMSNKQIARCLGIECATVKNHVHNILEKLQVRRRHEILSSVQPIRPCLTVSPTI